MNIDNIVNDYNAKIAEMQKNIRATLKDAFKEIFKECPSLHMICWAQYAPYFNDGDACEFSVNEMFAVNKDYADEDKNEEYEEFPSPWRFDDDFGKYSMQEPSWGEEEKKAWASTSQEYKNEAEKVGEFLSAISSIPDDVFQSAFGNDNTVYVFADRIVSEDFSGAHD